MFQHPCLHSCDRCASINVNDDVKLSLNCPSTCPEVVWYIEDPKPLMVNRDLTVDRLYKHLITPDGFF